MLFESNGIVAFKINIAAESIEDIKVVRIVQLRNNPPMQIKLPILLEEIKNGRTKTDREGNKGTTKTN
jgi:hypothetical protein